MHRLVLLGKRRRAAGCSLARVHFTLVLSSPCVWQMSGPPRSTVAMAIDFVSTILKRKYPQSVTSPAKTKPPEASDSMHDTPTTDSTATVVSLAGVPPEHTAQHTQLFVDGLEARGPYRAAKFGVRMAW